MLISSVLQRDSTSGERPEGIPASRYNPPSPLQLQPLRCAALQAGCREALPLNLHPPAPPALPLRVLRAAPAPTAPEARCSSCWVWGSAPQAPATPPYTYQPPHPRSLLPLQPLALTAPVVHCSSCWVWGSAPPASARCCPSRASACPAPTAHRALSARAPAAQQGHRSNKNKCSFSTGTCSTSVAKGRQQRLRFRCSMWDPHCGCLCPHVAHGSSNRRCAFHGTSLFLPHPTPPSRPPHSYHLVLAAAPPPPAPCPRWPPPATAAWAGRWCPQTPSCRGCPVMGYGNDLC